MKSLLTKYRQQIVLMILNRVNKFFKKSLDVSIQSYRIDWKLIYDIHYRDESSCRRQSWLTPTDRATRCITLSRHRAVHKAGRWVWSTCDDRRSTVDNTWRRSTCRRKIILSSEVGEKLQRILHLFDTGKFSPASEGALSPRLETLDPVETRPRLIHWLAVPCMQWLYIPTTLK